jgi:hypothetical protein
MSNKNKLNTPIKESSRCGLTLTDDHNGNHTDECSSAEEAEYMAGAGNYEIPGEDYPDGCSNGRYGIIVTGCSEVTGRRMTTV